MIRVFSHFFVRYQWLKQFIKFSIVGGVCTIFDFGFYLFLTRFFPFWQKHYLWANFLSVIFSATVNFIWNRNWTFKIKEGNIFWQYVKFWVAVLLGILIYQIILYLSVEKLALKDILGKILGAIFAWFLRFILNKFWTFR